MVIYLVGKGSSFSPERDRQKGVREVQKQERRERSTNRSKEQKISLALVSQVTTTVSLTAVMELKVWPQTVRERLEKKKKELHVNICSHRLPGWKKIHYILLVVPP